MDEERDRQAWEGLEKGLNFKLGTEVGMGSGENKAVLKLFDGLHASWNIDVIDNDAVGWGVRWR